MNEEILAFYRKEGPWYSRYTLTLTVMNRWNVAYSVAALLWREYIDRLIAEG